ncbi:hypothetical protein Tco_1319856 [Tanacetum coccineum]
MVESSKATMVESSKVESSKATENDYRKLLVTDEMVEYVVPTGRVVVPTGRYVVHASKVIIIFSPGRLSLVPTGRVLSPVKYDVSTSIGYGVSSFLSNTEYSSQQINTAYPLPLDTAYRSWVDVPTNDIFLTQERGAIIPTKLLQMPKYNPSKKWLNTLKNGTMEHLEEEVRIDKVYAAQVGCEQCKGPHYTKDCPQKEEGKTLEEAYYTQFGGPFQGGGYRAQQLQDAAIRNQEPSIKTVGEISNRANEQGASVSVMPLLTYLNLGLGELAHTRLRVELVNRTVKYPKGIAENCPPLEGGESLSPLILRRPFLSTARAKIDVSKKDYFKILEDMDAYRDDGMGDVILRTIRKRS